MHTQSNKIYQNENNIIINRLLLYESVEYRCRDKKFGFLLI
jgi:hypothetical protein